MKILLLFDDNGWEVISIDNLNYKTYQPKYLCNKKRRMHNTKRSKSKQKENQGILSTELDFDNPPNA